MRTNREPLTLLHLDEPVLALVLSFCGDAATLGLVASACRRLRQVVHSDFSNAWRMLRLHDHVDWVHASPEATVVKPSDEGSSHASGKAALAISSDGALFAVDGEHLQFVPLPGSNDGVSAFILREAANCAQAPMGEVTLAISRTDDARRATMAVAPRPSGHTRSTKVRCASVAGKSLRSLRVGGALSAMAAGHGFIATARRGSGIVQLWHAETGTHTHQLIAHAESGSIRCLAFRGRSMLISTSTDATTALHSLRELAPPAPPTENDAGALSCEHALSESKFLTEPQPLADTARTEGAWRAMAPCERWTRASVVSPATVLRWYAQSCMALGASVEERMDASSCIKSAQVDTFKSFVAIRSLLWGSLGRAPT